MKRTVGRQVGVLAGCLLAAVLAFWPGAARAIPPDVVEPPAAAKQLGEFSLDDATGAKHTLAEFAGRKAVVLFFLSTECPVSNGYSPDVARLAEKYAAQGVAFYGVHCDETLAPADVAKHAQEYHLTFPMLLDPTQVLARGAGVKVTPEVVVVSPTGKFWYQGRIDNLYSDGKRRDEPSVFDLDNALSAVLSGKAPAVSQTKAVGCPLPRPAAR